MRSRIIVTVSGGIVEIGDAQNWPEGLELYVVDYDATEGQEDEDVANVNGDCEINCYVGVHSDNGTFVEKVVTEYERLNA